MLPSIASKSHAWEKACVFKKSELFKDQIGAQSSFFERKAKKVNLKQQMRERQRHS